MVQLYRVDTHLHVKNINCRHKFTETERKPIIYIKNIQNKEQKK